MDPTRSPLLRYRDLKKGTLDLTPGGDNGHINGSAVDSLLTRHKMRLSSLVSSNKSSGTDPLAEAPALDGPPVPGASNKSSGTDPLAEAPALDGPPVPGASNKSSGTDPLAETRGRVKQISKVAQRNLEEKGASTLFLAAGLATWDTTANAPPNAPVILLPLSVEPMDATHREFTLKVSGDARFNPVMVHSIRADYGADLSEDNFNLEDPPNNLAGIKKILNRVSDSLSQVPGLNITPRLVVRNFQYNNMPLVTDLEQNLESFASNDVVAAIAGVPEARESLEPKVDFPSPDLLDIERPETEFLVLDADSSQHLAINWVLRGHSEVVLGPPGTGKSQTIANLIAALIADSKRVLFVAQKKAAVDVVMSRLKRVGLEDLIANCHGGIKSRREFSKGLANAIERIQSTPKGSYSDLHHELYHNRQVLVDHTETLHTKLKPWGITAYDVQAKLLEIPEKAKIHRGLSKEEMSRLDWDGLQALQKDVEQWIDLEGPYLTTRYPNWAGACPDSDDKARQLISVVRSLLDLLPQCHSSLSACTKEMSLKMPHAVADWPNLSELLAGIENCGRTFHSDIYRLDHARLSEALIPRSGFGRLTTKLSGTYRSARQVIRKCVLTGVKLSDEDICQAVTKAGKQARTWRQYCRDPTSPPQAPENASELHKQITELTSILDSLAEGINRPKLRDMSFMDLQSSLEDLYSDKMMAIRLPKLRKLEKRFNEAGIGKIISSVGKDVPVDLTASAIDHAWLQGIRDEISLDPRLSEFVGDAHNRHRDKFAKLDTQHLRQNSERVRRVAAEQAITAMNKHSDQTFLVKREARKKRRHLSVRGMIHKAPNVLCAIKPCWMMSPLQVAEMIPAGTNLFDVVIFDEASQIPPSEAIGALARARQTVVAGDDQQLPPTSFFKNQEEDVDDDYDDQNMALVSNLESILDAVRILPIKEKELQWHYRSRDGRLIAFSNNHIYSESLTIFPGTVKESPLIFHQLDLPPTTKTSTKSHPTEVEKVVDLILDHARQHPDESLGVIAFGSHHADNIEEGLRRRLSGENDPSLDEFFSATQGESFFVKNIERVQGDERDVIILSIGYHKGADGNLRLRFGPLNNEGGERRLNVAITRARYRIHVVAGFSHLDMDPKRSMSRGVELLRQYLEFAASGGTAMGGRVNGGQLNPFEMNVMRQLEKRGIPVTPQYGVASYRLDFACGHPEQRGRMVLAIEADGATYHSTPTARERDRLRQQVLESLGWRFHRIWSTDWFSDPEKQADLALEAWRKAVDLADAEDAGPVTRDDDRTLPSEDEPRAVQQDRGPRPSVSPGRAIWEYSTSNLVALAEWVMSDTLLRTDDDLLDELRRELGFERGGSLINTYLQNAIDKARSKEKLVK